jgi:hypothetical protein
VTGFAPGQAFMSAIMALIESPVRSVWTGATRIRLRGPEAGARRSIRRRSSSFPRAVGVQAREEIAAQHFIGQIQRLLTRCPAINRQDRPATIIDCGEPGRSISTMRGRGAGAGA